MSKDDPNDKKNKDEKPPDNWKEIFKHPRFVELVGQKKDEQEKAKTAEDKLSTTEAELKKYKDTEAAAKQKVLEDKGEYDAALKIANDATKAEKDKTEVAEKELKDSKDAYKLSEARTTFIQSKDEKIPSELVEIYVPQSSDEKELEDGWKKAKERFEEIMKGVKKFPVGINPPNKKKDPNLPDTRSPAQKIADGMQQRLTTQKK